jgi:hypothetical protein
MEIPETGFGGSTARQTAAKRTAIKIMDSFLCIISYSLVKVNLVYKKIVLLINKKDVIRLTDSYNFMNDRVGLNSADKFIFLLTIV